MISPHIDKLKAKLIQAKSNFSIPKKTAVEAVRYNPDSIKETKIGIFGDSYGAHKDGAKGSPWPEWLARNHELDVWNFCVGGSSLWYSLNMFLQEHEKFDKIVFLVTGVGRMWLKFHNRYRQFTNSGHINNPQSLEDIINQHYRGDKYMNEFLDAMKGYYRYLFDHEKETFFHQLMIKEIRKIRPDCLIIPCFDSLMDDHPYSLYDIHLIDIKHYKLDPEYSAQHENRHCHFNQENNIIFSEKIKRWIDTGYFKLDIADYTVSTQPMSYYFL